MEYYALWITRNGQHLWSGPHRSEAYAQASLDATIETYGHRIAAIVSLEEIQKTPGAEHIYEYVGPPAKKTLDKRDMDDFFRKYFPVN